MSQTHTKSTPEIKKIMSQFGGLIFLQVSRKSQRSGLVPDEKHVEEDLDPDVCLVHSFICLLWTYSQQ